MCELFAMSSLHPATVSFSLEEFAQHGGVTGPHKDGWGIAFYEGMDIKLIRESGSAGASPYIDFIKEHSHTSRIVISHIRLATLGDNSLHNSQPFSRELGGRMHVFAHNGDLPGIFDPDRFPTGHFCPIGDTDSEHAFCHLLNRMQQLWLCSKPPTIEERYRIVASFASSIRPLGPANFIYSDGEYLFAHGHKRTQAKTESIRPPGLHLLHRTCMPGRSGSKISGLELEYCGQPQEVVLIASVPLTDEAWEPFEEGEILVLKSGTIFKGNWNCD